MENQLIAVTGAPGSGKTTVLGVLSEQLLIEPEPARIVLAEHRAAADSADDELSPTDFVARILDHAVRAHERGSVLGQPVVFDRGVPDCVAYARYIGVDPAPASQAAGLLRHAQEVLLFRLLSSQNRLTSSPNT